MTMVQLPQPGQIVLLDGRGGPHFAAHPVRLRLTRTIESHTPGGGGNEQDPDTARWWTLTGHRLGPQDETLGLCTMIVRAAGVHVERPRPPAVTWGP
ncbi:MAG: hypothetical protein WCA46_18300 [Actinocatenispora sp.]